MKATIWTQRPNKDQSPSLCIRCPYDAQFVSAIKRELPAGTRWFDPKRKLWIVDLAYHTEAEAIVRKHYEDVTVVEEIGSKTEAAEITRLLKDVARLKRNLDTEREKAKRLPRPSPPRSNGSPYDTLVKVLGKAELKKLYHLAVQCSHPDHGGDTRTAQEVNLAWEKIREEQGI